MDLYSLVGSCIVNNETGRVVLESKDTPRNRGKMSTIVTRFNRRERERIQLERYMRSNRAAWL